MIYENLIPAYFPDQCVQQKVASVIVVFIRVGGNISLPVSKPLWSGAVRVIYERTIRIIL